MGFEADTFSTPLGVLFGIVTAVVVIGFVVIIGLAVGNAARLRSSGQNPLTIGTDLAVKLLDSEALAPAKSLESRLLDVDDLFAKGAITPEEHDTARARLLGG